MLVWLDAVRKTDVPRVGGKGASLGELLAAGIPLPPGFCLTAQAYRHFVAEGGLEPLIRQALAAPGVRAGDPLACEAASRILREALEAAAIPVRLSDAITQAYQRLGEGARVAVRSSATAEDLPDASFAGQQETFLNVCGLDSVLVHVRRCWSSLWTARAIAYRARQGYDHGEVALAVVVQRLIDAETAGVLFTLNPVTNERSELLVNASYGLGESVVSGLVTPDTYTLARTGRTLLKSTVLGTKEVQIRSLPAGGTVTEPVSEEARARPALTEPQLLALRDLGVRVETHYGYPQDIEWAFQKGELFLLQARPVTTAGEGPARSLRPSERKVVEDLLEHYPEAPWPLDHAAVVEGYEQLQHAMRALGLDPKPAEALMVLNAEGICRIEPGLPRPRLRLLLLPVLLWRRFRADSACWRPFLQGEPRAWAERLRARDPARLDNSALAATLREGLDLAAAIARFRFDQVVTPMFLRSAWLGVLARLARREVVAFEWLAGLSYRTVEVEADLQEVADLAQTLPEARELLLAGAPAPLLSALESSPALRPLHRALEAFLFKHGARTQKVYLPFSNRSWREDPSALVVTLAALVRAGDVGGALTRAQAGKARFEALLAEVGARLPGFLRRSLHRTVAAFREDHQGREETLYRIEEAFWLARRAVTVAGARLTEAGLLESPEQVKLLTLAELLEVLRGGPQDALHRQLARREARRQAAVQAWKAQRPVEVIGRTLEGTDGLKGVAGSPGQAEGPVRIVRGIEDFGTLQRGEVLVCPFTDPTWTPLFSLAAAVVADTGGPLSHAAIVAREYGIPAVLGTQEGTTRLKDGERVRVHGARGLVERLSPP